MKHPAQEQDVVPGRKLAIVVVTVIVVTVLSVWIAYGIGSCTSRRLGVRWTEGAPPKVPAEINAMETGVFVIEAQGIDLNQRAEAHLQGYGWVDRERQIVHVPIEVAFELYLARQRERGGSK